MWIIIIFMALFVMSPAEEEIYRTERQINSIPLVYPYGGTYKLLIGFATPVPTKDKIALLFAVNFQYQYAQFINISQLSKYYFVKKVSRDQRETDFGRDDMDRYDERLMFYKSVADMMTVRGMNGPECVLRAICEAAQYPLGSEGFVGELMHVLLTPDYGRTPFDDEDPDWPESSEMSSYHDAAVAGRQMFNCAAIFGACPEGEGLMELISTLTDD